MKRAELEHIIRAAGSIADAQRLVIIGSQAILGSFPHAPAELTISAEADTYPLDAPDLAVSKLAEERVQAIRPRLARCQTEAAG